jgi:hypothetical protein
MEEKEIIKKILNDGRDWKDVNDELPEYGKRVVIHYTNDEYTVYETDTQIYKAEAMAVGVLEEHDGEFHICPPYIKYEYSPLTKRSELINGTKVTHWAEATEEDLKDWDDQYMLDNKYEQFDFQVSEDMEENVYKTIIRARSIVNDIMAIKVSKDKNDMMYRLNSVIDHYLGVEDMTIETLKAMASILGDMQAMIDYSEHIKDGKLVENVNYGEQQTDLS